MTRWFHLLMILLLPAVALADNGNTTPIQDSFDIKELVINASTNLDTYRFSLEEMQDMTAINKTTGDEIYNARTVVLGAGGFNLTGRVLKIALSTLTIPAGQEENSVSVSTQSYIINNTTYVWSGCNWTAIELPLTEDIWRNQSRLEQSVEMMNLSDVRLIGTEEIDGKELYKVEVVPQSGAFSSLVREQLGPSYANLSSLFNNTSLRYILWITEDTHLPEREYVTMNMTLSPDDADLEGQQDQEIIINSSVTARYSDFNEPVRIVLPDDARNAMVQTLNTT